MGVYTYNVKNEVIKLQEVLGGALVFYRQRCSAEQARLFQIMVSVC